MKIVIVGAGSVGLTVAATSAIAGLDVTLVARGNSAAQVQTEGLRVTGVFGEHKIPPGKITVLDAPKSLPEADAIVMAIGATELVSALQELIPEKTTKLPLLLLLQNGWGSAQAAQQVVPRGTPIFSGTVMTWIERVSPTEIEIKGFRQAAVVGSLFGDDPASMNALIASLKKGFLHFAHDPMFELIMLKKLLFSLCMNSLGAVLRTTYGQMRESDYAVFLMETMANEAIKAIGAAREVVLFKDGTDYVRNELIPKLVEKGSTHRSSMLKDIEAGRRTEINYLNGAISKMGREHNIPTPCNDIIAALIMAMEEVAVI